MQAGSLCNLIFIVAMVAPGAISNDGQARFRTLPDETVQSRLQLYKGNDSVREAALKQLFTEAGCGADQLAEQPVPGRKQPNVICVLPAAEGDGKADVVVVGAHFDHVNDGSGIVDNWSGASLLPSLYQSLASEPRRHTFWFVGFTGEEAGEIGSRFYVKQLRDDQIARIEVMVNLDTLGLGPTEVWLNQSDPLMVQLLAKTARALHLPVTGMNVDGFGESDEESFIRRKVCTVMVHSITPATAHVLHHPDDNPKAIRSAEYYDSYHLLAAYLAVLDVTAVPQPHVCSARPVS